MSSTLEETPTPHDKAMSLIQTGKASNIKGNLKEAVAYYVDALIILQEQGDFTLAASTFIQIGNVYMNQSEFSEARNVYTDALGLSVFIEDKSMICKCYNSIGNAEGSMGNYEKAIESYQAGLDMARQMGDIGAEGKFYSNLSAIYVRQGNYAKTLENLLLCLRIWGDSADKNILQMVYINLADAYSKLRNYDEALTNALNAINLSVETGNKLMLSQGYITCAQIYAAKGLLTEAFDNYTATLAIKLEIGDKDGAAHTYNGMGEVYTQRNDYVMALDHHQKALAIFSEIESKAGIAASLNNIGGAYLNLRHYDEARKSLLHGLELSISLGHKESISFALQGLYKLNKQLGDAATALNYFERHVETANEMQNKEVAMQMSNLKTSYELEAKDKEKAAIEKILHNILPVSIANRIKHGEDKIIERFSNVSVLFADIAGFTTWSADKDVDDVASLLDKLFGIFDELALLHGIEKIKTIGDAYMCVAGLPEPCADHAERIAEMAIAMGNKIKMAFPQGDVRIRIGIHTGEVIAGIIGRNKYAYDLWGDTVNTASRMESHGIADKIQVSVEFKQLIQDKYEFEERGEISIKGKNKHKTFFLLHASGNAL
jgi:adenylate cyclase